MILKTQLTTQLSASRRQFLRECCLAGTRVDGREHEELREFGVNYDVLPNAFASVEVANGAARVLVAVGATLALFGGQERPYDSITVTARSIAPSSAAEEINLRNLESMISQFLCSTNALKLADLTVLEGVFYWRLHVDMLVIGATCAALQIASTGVFCALSDLRLPVVDFALGRSALDTQSEEFQAVVRSVVVQNAGASGVSAYQLAEQLRASFSDEPRRRVDFSGSLALAVVCAIIGDAVVVDPSFEELGAADATAVVALNARLELCGFCANLDRPDQSALCARIIKIAKHQAAKIFQQLCVPPAEAPRKRMLLGLPLSF